MAFFKTICKRPTTILKEEHCEAESQYTLTHLLQTQKKYDSKYFVTNSFVDLDSQYQLLSYNHLPTALLKNKLMYFTI